MPTVKHEAHFDHMLHFEGQKFFKGAVLLKENPVHYTNYPYWVLLAFSIELMLKSLSVKRTITLSKQKPSRINSTKIEHPKGHALKSVFDDLPENWRAWLSEELEVSYGFAIEEVLDENSAVFDQARYIYPKNGHIEYPHGFSVNERALYCLGELLVSIPERIQNN